MEVSTKTTTTYDLTGLTETQAEDLLYFAIQLPDADIPRNGRQTEFISTLRQTLLNAGVKNTKVTE